MEILKLGSDGPRISLLQSVLKHNLSLYKGKVDGIFGKQTLAAVVQFQQQYHLRPDGEVGPKTWAALLPYILGYTEYTVRPGDTLEALAKAYSSTVSAIKTANPGLIPKQLQVGETIVIPFDTPVVLTDIPYTTQALLLNMQGLKARYPGMMEVSVIGKSVLGRPLLVMRIGKGAKEVFYNASHHANEYITTPLLMAYAEQLMKELSQGDTVAGFHAPDYLETISLYICPMVNPDGVDLVTGYFPEGSPPYEQAMALNYPEDYPFPSGWKANLEGTDLNLNYPAGWEKAREIKFAQGYTRPGPRDYVGTAPLSAPESRAVAEFTQAHDFRLILAYHTQGNIIYWKYLDYNPPHAYIIGRVLSAASGYALEITPSQSGYAGYKDWFIQENNRPGYTIEAGLGENPLPLSQFPQIYRDNVGLLTLAALV
nr:M14 family metallopeptidase [bacterium]